MFLLLLLILFACVGTWLRWKWGVVRSHWERKGVPYSPPHPVLGSLTFLQKENPIFWMRRIYNKFKAPYVGIWLFWRPALVINSPDIARRVLVKDADNFRNRYLGSGKSDPIGALNIFTLNEPMWSSIRRRLTLVFTAAKLRSLEGLINIKTADLIKRIKNEMNIDPDQANLRVLCTDYTTDIIGEAAFGIKSEAALTGDSIMRKVTRDFMRFSVFRGLSWSSIFFWPSLVDIFGFSLFPKDTTEFLRKLFRGAVEMRGGYDHEVKEPRDLLDALLKLRQEAALDKEEISEDVLIAQAAVFVQGGFDTLGGAITWSLYELAHHPHLQEQLYEELVEMKQKLGKELDSAALTEATFLNAVIKETLRKYPPMGWLDRIAASEYRIDEHLTVPAGTVLYVNACGIMMDPALFPNPEVFSPTRFLPENEKDIEPYTYMPFGEGPRVCMRFAYQCMRLGLAAICINFKFHPLEGAAPPNEWPVEKKGMFASPDGRMSVIFTERN